MERTLLMTLFATSALTLGACGDDGGGGGGDAATDTSTGDSGARDTGIPDTSVADAGDAGGGCTYEGLTIEGPIDAEQDMEFLFWGGASVNDYPYDYLSIYLEYTDGADNGVHSFTFTGENYGTCHTCVLIDSDCDATDDCTQAFLPVSGTMEVTENGGTDGTFTAELSNLMLIEVEIDDTTFTSTPVTGGDTWCIDTLEVTGTTVAPMMP